MSERGRFRSARRAAQLISFEGLSYGKITPTDFDLVIDFSGRGFVLAELKYAGTPIPRGQELALERAADAWERANVPTLTLVAAHLVDIGDIVAANAIVQRIYWKRRWRDQTTGRTVAELIRRFHAHYIERTA